MSSFDRDLLLQIGATVRARLPDGGEIIGRVVDFEDQERAQPRNSWIAVNWTGAVERGPQWIPLDLLDCCGVSVEEAR
jgi:hypothetical protein